MGGTESGFDDVNYCFDGVDVGDDLSNAFHGVGAVAEEEDGGLLGRAGGTRRWLIII